MRTNDWNDWHAFVLVSTLGSFTRAAERLDAPKSSISQAVARLERRLGERLLERSTRSLRLTARGAALLRELGPLFERLEEVAEGDAALGDVPRGVLRIAAPYEFGALQLGDVINRMLLDYPQLGIEVEVVGRRVDPLVEGYDIAFAITADALPDSSQIAKKVYSVERGLYASPALLQRLGRPRTVAELAGWPVVAAPTEAQWVFIDGDGAREAVDLQPRLRTPNAGLRVQAVLAGLGLSVISHRYCQAEVDAGRLVRVLPGHTPENLRIYALMPTRRLMPTKTRLFMQALEQSVLPLA
ncbi:LysR family transcriptional regulator [Chitinimonas naiadis]